jgi:RNA 3'-phosphate cyclase
LDIEIDGSWGEGGGQIARTAVGFSCALGKSVSVRNIRKGRRQPGLKAQHLAGMKLAAEMCDAEVSGLDIGSTEVEFSPRNNLGGAFSSDVGTAGSVSLVLQTCMLPAITARGPTDLTIGGGTDVPWSPPIDYLRMVILPLLRRMGVDAEISVVQRGFYPAGGG